MLQHSQYFFAALVVYDKKGSKYCQYFYQFDVLKAHFILSFLALHCIPPVSLLMYVFSCKDSF